MNKEVMFSSSRDDWETPQEFFKQLDQEFHFTLDAAASDANHKCEKYYTEKENGLIRDWSGETVFCNPPYSRKNNQQDQWVEKCYKESQKPGTTVVLLIPARTDTERFHDYILGKGEVRFIKGRLAFEIGGRPILDSKGKPSKAPFPSMIVIYRRDEEWHGIWRIKYD